MTALATGLALVADVGLAAPLGRVGVWPIEEVVEWSRTTHGGQQFDLLPPDPDAGCMRWGLCETRGGEP